MLTFCIVVTCLSCLALGWALWALVKLGEENDGQLEVIADLTAQRDAARLREQQTAEANGKRIVELERMYAELKGRPAKEDARVGQLKAEVERLNAAVDAAIADKGLILEALADVLVVRGYKVER